MTHPDQQRDQYGGCTAIKGKATGFFHTEEIGGRWWFVTPEGNAFISMGMNHLDPASIKCPENVHIFRERYGASNERFIAEGIAAPLREWGFNTLGWVQELVGGKWEKRKVEPIRHSVEWPYAWYKAAGMPYIYNFVFAEIEDFNCKPHYPDVYGAIFEDWADYQARVACVDMADEPLLLGYADLPVPNFTRKVPGSWAEHLDLDNPDDLEELKAKVHQYFKITTEAIRRYDPNHLVLGPRFFGVPDTPKWVIEIAGQYLDVMLCNWFIPPEKIATDLADWSKISGRPVLIADMAFLAPTDRLPIGPGGKNYAPDQKARGEAFANFNSKALRHPYILGHHWCAFMENKARGSGIKTYLDEPYQDCVDGMQEFNCNRLYATALGLDDS